MQKRFLTGLLTLCLVVNLLPISVLAADAGTDEFVVEDEVDAQTEEAVDDEQEEETVHDGQEEDVAADKQGGNAADADISSSDIQTKVEETEAEMSEETEKAISLSENDIVLEENEDAQASLKGHIMPIEEEILLEDDAMAERDGDAEDQETKPMVFADTVTSGTCGKNLTWMLEAGTLTISGTGEMYDYFDSPYCPWYSGRDEISKVIIYNGVTSIGNCAFEDCGNLTSIIIPSSVTSIGADAFYGCKSLDNISIPDSVTSIGICAFMMCSGLTNITIPSSVTSIGSNAFADCGALTSITILDSVTSIGKYAFSGCSNLTEVHISSVENWCKIGFLYDSNPLCNGGNLYVNGNLIEDLIIPDGMTSINEYAFDGCSSLRSITIPDSVTSIGSDAFKHCKNLTGITIPDDSVTNIGESAFYDCSSLTDVTIPNGVTSIGDSAFSYCRSMRSIVIPDSVIEIGYDAFETCDSLERVYISRINSWCSITFDYYSSNPLYLSGNLYVDGDLIEDLIIPDGVTEIKKHAFRGCSALTSITIPDSVTSIGSDAFRECGALTSITIPDSVTSIGSDVFMYCRSLQSIIIPDGMTHISSGAFECCNSLTSITIPSSVTSIDALAFSGCISLSDIYYGGSEDDWEAISIGSDNDPLTSATVHYNTQIGSAGDNLNWTVDINGVLSIYGAGKMADYNDSDSPAPWSSRREEIKSVVIGQFVTSIGTSAFSGCTNLTKISIPSAVVSIGDSAFSGCDNLAEVDFIGNQTQWSLIAVGTDNKPLTKAHVSYRYSGTGSDKTDMRVQTKQVSYYDTIHSVSNTMDIQWGWSMMESSGYDNQAAIAGLVLSGATESSQGNAEQAMKDLGFTSKAPISYSYNKEWYEIAQPAVTFGYKHIIYDNDRDGHFFAIAVRGTSDMADGLTDAASLVGSFQVGAEFVYTELESYMIECCGMTLEDIKESGNVQFYVTGHSLGGAVANITAKKLIEDYGASSVKAYTFAAPPCATIFDVIFAGASYDLYNIINNEDIVTKASWLINGLVTRNGKDISFHRNDDPDIYTRFRTLTGGKDLKELMTKWTILGSFIPILTIDRNLTRKLCAHSPSVYMAYLANSVTSKYNGKRIVVRCPVDVEVYAEDEDGAFLVCRITDNKIDDTIPTGVYAYVEGDEKYIELLYDGDYTIKLTATDSGTMTYAVQDVNNETGQITEEKVYSNVALADGKEMTSSVSVWDKTDITVDAEDKVDTPQVQLFVLDSEGAPEKEVLADGNGTEVPVVTCAHVLSKTEALAPTCGKDGHIAYYTCSKCSRKFSDENGTKEITDADIVVKATGQHGETEVRDAVAATEEKEGYTGDTYCKVCGMKLETGTVVSQMSHTHAMVKTSARDADCETDGNIEYYTCTKCGKTFADEAGQKEVTDVVVKALGHKAGSEWKTDSENHWKTCSVCGQRMEVEAHDFKWVVDKPATEDETGISHEECICGGRRKENTVISKPDHVHTGIVHYNAAAATCVKAGNKEYWTCASSKCEGKYYGDASCQVVLQDIAIAIDPNNHVDEGRWATTKEEHSWVCLCGAVIDIGAHVYENEADALCNVCGYQRFYQVIDGANGSYEQGADNDYIVRADGDFALFASVKIDGTTLATDVYTAAAGSTVITLRKAYLDTLTVGVHKVEVVYTDGKTAETQITIQAMKTENDSSATTEQEESENTEPIVPEMSDKDGAVALINSPKTGQEDRAWIWVALIVVIVFGGAGALLYLRKNGQS